MKKALTTATVVKKAPAKKAPSKRALIKEARIAIIDQSNGSTLRAEKAETKTPARKLPTRKATTKTTLLPSFNDYAPRWSPLQTRIFDFIRGGIGSAIVQAVAGSGKTTTICEGIQYMAGTVATVAFNKSIALELGARLSLFHNVTAGTVHALGKRALESALGNVWVKVEPSKLKWLWKDNMETKENSACMGSVLKLTTLAKDQGAGIDFEFSDRQRWQDIAEHFSVKLVIENKISDKQFDIIAMAQELLQLSNNDRKPIKGGREMIRIDFSDMIYLSVLWEIEMPKFDWIIVDEAQDLNRTRQLFVKGLAHEKSRLVIVGDSSQAIYGFTGADSRSMETMREMFSATQFPLSVCYRCAVSIVELAQTWMPGIEASPSAPLGEISASDYVETMANAATTFLPTDAILCRNNAPLIKTCMELIRANIPCRLMGVDIADTLVKLAKQYKGKSGSLRTLRKALVAGSTVTITECTAKGWNKRADKLAQDVESLLVFLDRAIVSKRDFDGFINGIKAFFDLMEKNEKSQGVITLSSIHRSKGSEWERVFWIDRAQFQPSPFAKQEWEQQQEANLLYVAATRAKHSLVDLTSFPRPETASADGEGEEE